MTRRDEIYTPTELAKELVDHLSKPIVPRLIADFAVGDGRLLDAAHKKFPTSKIVAVDISKRVISKLRITRPKWFAYRADFLTYPNNELSRLSRHEHGIDLVLLNPPFSNRGNARWGAAIDGRDVECSRAMAFLVRALSFLSAKGELLAIMPNGSLTSERDELGWNLLRKRFDLQTLRLNGSSAFPGWRPTTAIVRLRPKIDGLSTGRPVRSSGNGEQPISVQLMRGSLPVFKASVCQHRSGYPFVHTTNIRDHELVLGKTKVMHERVVIGPAVLFQRVGKPDIRKLCVVSRKRPVVLSDCLFAIRCTNTSDAIEVSRRVTRSWELLESRYGGTGAPYITQKRLAHALGDIGIMVDEAPSRNDL